MQMRSVLFSVLLTLLFSICPLNGYAVQRLNHTGRAKLYGFGCTYGLPPTSVCGGRRPPQRRLSRGASSESSSPSASTRRLLLRGRTFSWRVHPRRLPGRCCPSRTRRPRLMSRTGCLRQFPSARARRLSCRLGALAVVRVAASTGGFMADARWAHPRSPSPVPRVRPPSPPPPPRPPGRARACAHPPRFDSPVDAKGFHVAQSR